MIENLAIILILFLVILPFSERYISGRVFSTLKNITNYSLFASIYYILADAFVEGTLLNFTPNRIQEFSFGFNILPESVEDYTFFLTSIIAIGISVSLFQLQNGNIRPRRYDLAIQFLAIFAFLPFVLYFWTHIMYLKETDSSWLFDLTFMEEMAGFTLSNEWPFDTVLQDTRWQFYRVGLFNAIRVVVLSIFGCTIIGVIVGVSRLSRNRLLSGLAESYVEFFRNMPLVVQLFFLYTVVLGANLPIFADVQDNTFFGWIYWSNRGIVGPGAGIENMSYFLGAFAVYLGARTYIRFSERIEIVKPVEIWNPILLIPILNWWPYLHSMFSGAYSKGNIKVNSKFSLAVDILFSFSVLIVIYGLFNAVEWNYKISI